MLSLVDKAQTAKAFREKYLELVRAGKMTVEQYLRDICAVPEHKIEAMKAHVKV